MPGPQYLDSIVNYWRVYAGHTPEAADACECFLSAVVNVDEYPLTRLGSTTASETSKVLEHSYRALTIAFMEEWGRFAEAAGFDLFEAIDAIRMRPTHTNMGQPGFGVGGYCLTKDPPFAEFGARELLGFQQLEFPFSERALEVNDVMPLVTLDKVEQLWGLGGRRILPARRLLPGGCGRHTRIARRDLRRRGEEAGRRCRRPGPAGERHGRGPGRSGGGRAARPIGFDAVVFAVPHSQHAELDLPDWPGEAKPLVVDASRVLDAEKLRELAGSGLRVGASGGGEIAA